MIFFFSGTGNSYWTAKTLGCLINEPTERILKYRDTPLVCSDDVIGFVCPLYMWNLPSVIKNILENAKLGENSYIFLLLTANHSFEKNMEYKCPVYKAVDELIKKAGGKLSAGFLLQMPGNALESSKEENAQRLAAAPDKVKKFAEDIGGRVCNYKYEPNPMLDMFKGKIMKGGKGVSTLSEFTIIDECNGCGVCSQVCPMNNIVIMDGKPIHGKDCTLCLACLHWCPKQATKSEKIKRRLQYTPPEVTLDEMIGAKTGK